MAFERNYLRDYLMFYIPIALITLFFVGLYALRSGFSQSFAIRDLLTRQYGPKKARSVGWLLVACALLGLFGIFALWRGCVVDTAMRMR